MKIFIKAKPNSKKEEVKKISENHYEVSVKEPPIEGKANQAIIRVLSDYFSCSVSKVNILVGHHSRNKIIAIDK